jgi:6,7-dimethyl-8-ribityllumazine synthase
VIKGETSHNEYINMAVANGLVNLSIASGRPFIFGLLTPNDEQQALDRAGGKHGNKGVEAAVTAIRMAALKDFGTEKKKSIGF